MTYGEEPDCHAHAAELADLLARAQPYVQASDRSYARWLADASSQALARYPREEVERAGGRIELWQALAGELAEWVEAFIFSCEQRDIKVRKEPKDVLVRYHEAIAQHSGEPHG
jgi:hypothetical protein